MDDPYGYNPTPTAKEQNICKYMLCTYGKFFMFPYCYNLTAKEQNIAETFFSLLWTDCPCLLSLQSKIILYYLCLQSYSYCKGTNHCLNYLRLQSYPYCKGTKHCLNYAAFLWTVWPCFLAVNI